MLRSLSSSSPTVASSTSSAAPPTCSRHWKGIRSSYGSIEVNNKPAKELENSYREYLKLKGRYENLQRQQRNLLGEDLGPLNSKELEQLERQLDGSLKQVRCIKTQYMLDQLLIFKEEHGKVVINIIAYGHPQAHSQGLYQSLECDPTLQIGYSHPVCSEQMAVTTQGHPQPGNGYIPGWML
ncbi:Transcription factor K-box [Arabidopsis suecica]|uniref:Transcription factor K-box n=1 Tax=Arabidopsis suecica TaxID=45249 RepID=A0A8T1XDP2_ARASU|nr:Transcription factor K-box [Arabidopsis suecica]